MGKVQSPEAPEAPEALTHRPLLLGFYFVHIVSTFGYLVFDVSTY